MLSLLPLLLVPTCALLLRPDPGFLFLKVKELKEVFQSGALFSRRRFGAKTASLETILSDQFIFSWVSNTNVDRNEHTTRKHAENSVDGYK